MKRTGFVWDEKYVWFDSRTYSDWLPPEAFFQPMPSPETAEGKRRFKNLLDATGITPQLTVIPSRLAEVREIERVHDRDYINRIKALSDDHFGVGPDEINWGHVATLAHYAELLKRITDSAFKEGEHAE